MKSVNEYIKYLFGCNFYDENFDPEDYEEHLKASWDMMDSYSWSEIYPALVHHLHENCHTPEEVINFANLYIYYECSDNKIDDPISFVSYLYYMVDMDLYWDEAGELFDSLSINILTKSKLVDLMKDPYYTPLKDQRIISRINKLKEQGV